MSVHAKTASQASTSSRWWRWRTWSRTWSARSATERTVRDIRGLAYDRGPEAPALLETTIGANLASTAAAHAERDAMVDLPSGRRWNYREFHDAVRRLASGLLR